MSLLEEYSQKIYENANYFIASYKKGAIAFTIVMVLLSFFGSWMITKIGLSKNDKIKYIIIIFCIALIMSIVFWLYSIKQISCIRSEIENEEWVEYSGEVVFDASRNRLELVNSGNSIPLFSGKDKNGIIDNNYVNIPTGYIECYIVYLKKTKAVVLFIPSVGLAVSDSQE